MRIIGRFGLKASFFLYLLSYFVLAGAFLGFFEYPHFILLAALAYLAAYHLACGRILLPLLTYAVGLALLWLNRVAPPSRVLGPLPIDISWVMLYFPFAAGALIIYSVAYATGVAKKILSVILLVAAVIAGHFYMVYAGVLWRALVPAIGLAPVFPEPQDFPLYILLYELWRIIHQKPLKLNCQKQTT
ncbi:hypothetical protein [Pyrobaculum ferrireducens]|uniref:Uncharacterized protein n=1 Tax=Pyrobaculum ferrireducens TaxID=1104324 RepID=G7VCR1_9CREN|nr:hypothetical protein [Pyrobaculum ferrireducens]AET33866.1 hypothetical protein P186_2480 [Pyrobaculum ferrireducens]